MDINQTTMLLGIISELYPRFAKDPTRATVAVWHEMLGDLDYTAAQLAVKKHVAASKYPPTVAEIRDCAATLTNPTIPTQGEAWEETMRAISNYGIYREAEALAALQPQTQTAVRQIGWRALCMTETDDLMATRAHFFKLYGAVADKAQDNYVMLPEVRDKISALMLTTAEGRQTQALQALQGPQELDAPVQLRPVEFANGLQQIGGIVAMLGGGERRPALSVQEKAAKDLANFKAYIQDQKNLEKATGGGAS